MKLTIKERLALQQLLPREGSLQEQITVESIVKKTTVTRKDVEEVGGKVDPMGNIDLGIASDNGKEVEFDDHEMTLVKMKCKDAVDGNKVSQQNLSLIRKVLGL